MGIREECVFIEEIHSILKSSETKNFQVYSKLIHFNKLAYRLQLKDLTGFGKF